ncbi:MAG: pseudaminic acid synthase [Mariniblastus sp.]|nr:pseudaminic acid synthase [Mariniblastus sp.]
MGSGCIQIGSHQVGEKCPVYLIAELSANHGHCLKKTRELIRAAAEAGANAIKLQTYTADTLTLDCDNPYFQIDHATQWDGQNFHSLYRQAEMPWDWQPQLKQIANDLGLELFSSPFDSTAVDFLEEMDVPAYKIASFEIVDIPLLEYVARTGRPTILSTGMATLEEIELAVETLESNGCPDIALLKCTSAYPAPMKSMNLHTIPALGSHFQKPVGLSDHSLGIEAAVASVCLGASIIEKHLTLSRSDGGPDSGFSLEPSEFQAMATAVRNVEQALGEVHFGPTRYDSKNTDFRRSLFVVTDVKRGDLLTEENIRSIRPGMGLAPKNMREVIGKVAQTDIDRGTPLRWDHIA